ncbi:histone demethylase [Aureococcus anophagefferens]|nr:histone demethylase [Aureococcus anophagefferens]
MPTSARRCRAVHEPQRRAPGPTTSSPSSPAARDGRGDVARASRVREALEALKAPLAPAWDNDECVALRAAASGAAFAGWFSLDDLLAARRRGRGRRGGPRRPGRRRRLADGARAPGRARVPRRRRGRPGRATVVLNSLDATCPRVAALSLAAVDAFGLPACVNLYATGAGARVSAPPHTDTQRVLVMQCHGNKRWRVWRPPRPDRRPGADPLARGKGDDVLELGELEETPAADVVLTPGDCLYVPAGWPHTTDTLECAVDDEPSVHLTLGVDTHIWGSTAWRWALAPRRTTPWRARRPRT